MPKVTRGSDLVGFIHELTFADLPRPVQAQAKLCLLDLIGVGIGGAETPLSRIIRDHAAMMFGGGSTSLLFDGRPCSPVGAALAGGMGIDALDAHDGFNPNKGHIGCGVFPGALAMAQAEGKGDGRDFLTAIVIGYELGARFGQALHASVADYHTSGAWVAPAVAAIGARMLGLNRAQTRHAMGIAEYHGPRSQMMRCIDHPTMVKDGSGWGAMAGVSAAYLARAGFTGAPAITAEGAEVARFWGDLGQTWLIEAQYFKPYPVCRWAQAPIEGVLALKRAHDLRADMVDHIEIATFHESVRLATRRPADTEQAQYSTSYPCAVALVKSNVGPAEVSPAALNDPEVLRLSQGLVMREDAHCNATFPAQRHAIVSLHLKDGRVLTSGLMSPQWTAEAPPGAAELRQKYHGLADPRVGVTRATAIETQIAALSSGGDVGDLSALVCQPNDPIEAG
ncbi:MAG: MmgE/PrpD family protein [Rhodobacteraceae bacterium]|nr:MmgE/PrpD family protein [Paracoccaceae bacterium]